MLQVRPNPAAFERLRRKNQALMLTQGDRAGPLLRLLDRVHIVQVRRAFSTEGATVASGPWVRLSPRYAAWKRKQVGRKKMMRFTDTLYEKATSPTHGNHIAMFIAPFKYAFGFRDEPGYRHEHGEPPLPRRSLVDKTQQDLDAFRSALLTFWKARIRQVLRRSR